MPVSIRQIDLNLLRLLLKIHEIRSVSKAGAEFGLSQPASSNALARLREMLDDPLFVRTRNGMTPTTYTETIVPLVARHLEALFDVLQSTPVFDPGSSRQVFHLSLSDLGESVFLPRLVQRVFRLAPGIRLFNRAASSAELSDVLERRQADVAIGVLPASERGLLAAALFSEAYVLIAGNGTAPAAHSPHFPELRRSRLLLAAPSAAVAGEMESMLDGMGLAEQVVLRLRHFAAVPELLAELDIVAIVPALYGEQLVRKGEARLLPQALPLPAYQVNMVWHENTDNDPACRWLRQQILHLFSNQPLPEQTR